MRQADNQRQSGVINATKKSVDDLKKQTTVYHQLNREPKTGTCIVQSAIALGSGSICDVEVMSNGRTTGLKYNDCHCHSARLKVGSVVQFFKKSDGTIELISGGAAVTQATTPITTSNNQTVIIIAGYGASTL